MNLPPTLSKLTSFISWNEKLRLCFWRFCVCGIIILSGFMASGQRLPLRFENISTNAGLSQSNVMCIFQDSRGFMWFGTRDGLNKYDGYKFTVYKNDLSNENTLSHNTIQAIEEDADGNIWIGTWGGGVNKFDWKKDKFYRYNYTKTSPNGLGDHRVNRIYRDRNGNLWVGTEGRGMSIYDKKGDRFIPFVHDESNPNSLANNIVRDIVEDRDGNLWLATGGGLDKFTPSTKTFIHFSHNPAVPGSLVGNDLAKLHIDRHFRLWIGTRSEGLDRMDPATGNFIHYKKGGAGELQSNGIKALAEDDAGRFWVGTENGGLSIFNEANENFETYLKDEVDFAGLNSNSIWSLLCDSKGNMWVGTFSGGINLYSRDASKFTHYRHTSMPFSLSHNNVLSIFEDSDNDLWVGTDGGGINLFDRSTGTFTRYMNNQADTNSLSGDYVLDLYEDHEKNLWIGTWADGVTVFNKRTKKFKRFKFNPNNPKGISSPNVWTIFEDSDKNIWLGTYSAGVSRYDRASGEFVHYQHDANDPTSLSTNTINVIFEDSRRNLWVGTNGTGLDMFDRKTQRFSHYPASGNKNGLTNNDVFCMAEDNAGNLWVGTSMGLNKMERNGKFTAFYTRDGLPSNTILGILVDKKGLLWISTFNGLSKFNPATKTFTNFNTNDGLQSREFKMNSCFLSRSGKMYFGGVNGFNEFSPESLREKKYDPPLVFTDFLVFNKQVPIGDDEHSILKESISNTKEITLSHDQSVITFEFASLNYAVEEKKQYAYFLEGFDVEWNNVGTKHSATYTNLNPGEYTFKVRKLNNEGQWSLAVASIHLTITPPYWLTWWFRIAVVVLVLAIVLLVYRLRVRAIKAQGVRLQTLVNEKTGQLQRLTQEEHNARREAEKARLEAEMANQSLERKNKELEQFAYVASHDMQEPLRTTSSYVGLLQKQYSGRLDERADKYLTYIVQSSDRMKVLIKDLLDFSRIGVKSKTESVDCNSIIVDLRQDLEIAIQESGAQIKSCRLPIVTGYPTELKQLFQNLVVNAIKFRKPEQTPVINICAKQKQGSWHFSISDNGIGIDSKHSEKIFIIFQRLHSRNVYEGSGIGLAHCKKIVELHGGKIWVESELSKGSTFHFTIPDTQDNRSA
jgi:signal transduction histidine kinase/ligand-binding sensor domain-containing protein